LQAVEKSGISENVNTHSNRDSDVNASPQKKSELSLPKPPKEEEKIVLNNKENGENEDGGMKKKNCC